MANCIRCGRQLSGFTFGKKICPWCVQHEAAQRGEVSENAPQPVMPTPWVRHEESAIGVTQVIFGINALVFVGMVIASGGSIMDFPTSELVRCGANVGVFTISGEWWRLLTNVFVHEGSFTSRSTCGVCGIWGNCARRFTDDGPTRGYILSAASELV